MKIFKYVLSYAFLFIGAGFLTHGPVMPEDIANPLKPIALGIAFLMWGIGLNWYTWKNYRGGAASIAGAVLAGFGLYSCTDIVYPDSSWTSTQKVAVYLAVVLLFIGGAALLRQGHRIHKKAVAK